MRCAEEAHFGCQCEPRSWQKTRSPSSEHITELETHVVDTQQNSSFMVAQPHMIATDGVSCEECQAVVDAHGALEKSCEALVWQ